jgi:hypothetical protein
MTLALRQSGMSLTATGTSTGTDNAAFTLQGVAIANSFQINGAIGSNSVFLAGIYVPIKSAIYVSQVSTPNGPCSDGYYPIGILTLNEN